MTLVNNLTEGAHRRLWLYHSAIFSLHLISIYFMTKWNKLFGVRPSYLMLDFLYFYLSALSCELSRWLYIDSRQLWINMYVVIGYIWIAWSAQRRKSYHKLWRSAPRLSILRLVKRSYSGALFNISLSKMFYRYKCHGKRRLSILYFIF